MIPSDEGITSRFREVLSHGHSYTTLRHKEMYHQTRAE
jgi:hypothetical protein